MISTTESQKEKDTCFNAHAGGKLTVQCSYSKQTNLEGVYSWNKMWLLKSLVMLKYESRIELLSLHVEVTVRLCSDVLSLLF